MHLHDAVNPTYLSILNPISAQAYLPLQEMIGDQATKPGAGCSELSQGGRDDIACLLTLLYL